MTTRELVSLARRACKRAEQRMAAARRSGNALELQAASLLWQRSLQDMHRVLVAVGQ